MAEVALILDNRRIILAQPISRPITLIAASLGVFDAPSLRHLKSLCMPNMTLHPHAILLLPQFKLIQQEPQFSPVFPAA